MASKIADAFKATTTAQAKYLALQESGTQAEIRAASDAVKAARLALSNAIAEGAEPCPVCKRPAHGMMQEVERKPDGSLRYEFEVGCLHCGAAARGGPLPRHAVEGWNAGPEAWMRQPSDRAVLEAEERDKAEAGK